jgi:hypothetical protein
MLILGNFIHKCSINSLVVHPKFGTGAAKNLWRAALWPPLLYINIKFNLTWIAEFVNWNPMHIQLVSLLIFV